MEICLYCVVHQYQNIEGNEGKFPSVEYIMSKLTGTNKVTSDAQVELWEKQYSTTKVFKDEQSLNAAKAEATKYFPEEAITTWEDNKGNYVMKVAEPQLIGEALEREYERILANAPKDKEGRLLAPNGKPSNLNERQYAQVRSKAFIRWFGDWINDPANASKVLDENGEPMIVYHGSDSYGFNTFNPLKSDDKLSLFFSDNKGIASTYTKHIPILNNYLRNKLLDNGAITLIESNKWEELTELINSLYGFKPLLDWLHGESDKDYYQVELKETLEHIKNNNLSSQDAKALLDEVWDFQQKNHKKGAYSIKVFAHKGQYNIKIIDNYEHENSGHIVEEGVIFEGSKESLIDSIQNETKIYGVYLNIKNPLEVNGTNDEGITSNWNNLNFVGDDGIRPGITVSRRDIWGNVIPGTKQFRQRTRDITKYANQKGYDGVIFENISDKGPYSNKYEQLTDQDVLQDTINDGVDFYDNLKRNRSKVIVAYSPNQIKSAENVGTFETREDNIYHDNLPISSRDTRDTTLLNLFEANNNKEYATAESEVSIVDLINRIEDSEYSSIIELLKNKFGNRKSETKLLAGIKVKLINPLNAARGYEDVFIKALNFGGRRAFYNASNKTIYVNVDANYNKGNSSGVLLHEIIHALTVDRILSNPEAKAKFEQILKDYQNSNFDPRYREGADHPLEEFIANIWSDPVTIENLKKIKSSRVDQSLWNEIKEFFSDLFSGIFAGTSSDSLMAEASVEMIKLLESPIIIRNNDKFREGLGISYYSGNITPDENTIFVFGSNPEGRHGAGAAKVAREQFGAKYGIGEGLQGNAYALPTKDLRVTANKGLRSISREQIIENIKKLYSVARSMPEKTFKVAYTNGATEFTLNGYNGQEMVEMFLSAGDIPSNVQFSENWKPMLEQGISTSRSFSNNSINEPQPETQLPSELNNNLDDNTEITEETEEIKQEFFEDTLEAFSKSSQKLTSQMNNLLESNIILATEARHLAEQAVYWISDHITELQENPDLIVKIYGEGLKDFNVEEATRAGIVRAIGPSNIIAMCKEKFSPSEGKYSKRSTNRKARLIIDNWEALMKLASDVFANIEDFAIIGNEINEEINADADNFNDSNNQDDVAETEGDTQEHWQVETRTLDVLSSMSQLVRQALTKCYILETSIDNEGKLIV